MIKYFIGRPNSGFESGYFMWSSEANAKADLSSDEILLHEHVMEEGHDDTVVANRDKVTELPYNLFEYGDYDNEESYRWNVPFELEELLERTQEWFERTYDASDYLSNVYYKEALINAYMFGTDVVAYMRKRLPR